MHAAVGHITVRRLKQGLLRDKMAVKSNKGFRFIGILSVYQYLRQQCLKIIGGERKQIYQRLYFVLAAAL